MNMNMNLNSKFILEDKITERLEGFQRTNENIIYVVDVHCEIFYTSELKKQESKRKKELVILKDKLYCKNYGENSDEHFYNECLRKLKLSEKQQMKIKKIVLKRELSYSFYERKN